MFRILLYFLILDLTASSEDFDPTYCIANKTCPQTWAVQYTYKSDESSGICGGILSGENHFGGSCKASQTAGEVTSINVTLVTV